jgi:hypothetical protein
MRIIDKQNDYYDYLQDNEDTLVFDRRGSRLLTKEKIKDTVEGVLNSYYHVPHVFFLLQCGASYWLLFVEGTDIKKRTGFCGPAEVVGNYNIWVLSEWKEYNQPLKLLSFQAITFNQSWKYKFYDIHYYRRGIKRDLVIDRLRENSRALQEAVIHKDYGVFIDFSKDGYLLLKSSGIPNVIPPAEMYSAIDEYFSLKKTAAESTVAEGTTNNDKIKNHGFDTKTSFRGK